jgi:Sec-independent protein translocase protein TatA
MFNHSKIALLLLTGCIVLGCAPIKETGRTIGHTTRDVTKEIGHGARDVTREIGHGTRDVVNEIGEGTRDAVKSGSKR